MLNTGIIGTGKHGSRYARHIVNDLPNMRLAAISRRGDEGRSQAEKWGCRWYRKWNELVADPEIHAVIAVVPPVLNLEIATECCRHGKALLVEKPLATSGRDAARIVDMFSKSGIPLSVGQTLRYNPVIQGLKEHFSRLGACYSFSLNQRIEPSTLAWLEDPEQAGAGVILHTAVHLFDALRFITGFEIARVRAISRKIHNPNLEDLLLVQVECTNGSVGIIDTSKISPARTGRLEFIGENGHLHGEQIYGRLLWIEGTEITSLPCTPPGPTIVTLLSQWYNYLVKRGENPVTGHDGAMAVHACMACLKSVESGNWEEINNSKPL